MDELLLVHADGAVAGVAGDVPGGSRGPPSPVRLHGTTLYNSVYRFDQTMLVNTHAYGSPAAQNPVLHLQRILAVARRRG